MFLSLIIFTNNFYVCLSRRSILIWILASSGIQMCFVVYRTSYNTSM